jgi:hypothetical protein
MKIKGPQKRKSKKKLKEEPKKVFKLNVEPEIFPYSQYKPFPVKTSSSLQSCKYCKLQFMSETLLNQHIQKVHSNKLENNYGCNLCDTRNGNEKLRNHLRRKHHPTYYICSLCNETYGDVEDIAQHLRAKHEADIEINCSKRGYKFINRGQIHVQKLWVCEHCNQSFDSVSEYNDHYKVHKK